MLSGDVLHVTGEARIIWEDDTNPAAPRTNRGGPSRSGSTSPSKKSIEIKVLEVVHAHAANPLRLVLAELSPFNPPVPLPQGHTAAGSRAGGAEEVPGGPTGGERGAAELAEQGRPLSCVEVVSPAKGIKSFRFKPLDQGGGAMEWTPGQFATFFFPTGSQDKGDVFMLPREGGVGGGGDDSVVRTWTITSVGGKGSLLEITVKAKAGGVSEHLHSHLRPGHLVRATVGGDFTLPLRMGSQPGRGDKIMLLSAGIGITPMLSAVRWLRAERG
ncbi:unnamed protein product, partial [Discosporangium mesarthrocarpum]